MREYEEFFKGLSAAERKAIAPFHEANKEAALAADEERKMIAEQESGNTLFDLGQDAAVRDA